MYHYYCLVTAIVIFYLYAYFPMSPDVNRNHQTNLPTNIDSLRISNVTEVYPRHFDKVVLMVIDALRVDFVTAELMPFTTKTMLKTGCFSNIKVESPTVTLPRIKAMTSGNIPQYIDLIKNLATSEILSDSWLHSAKEQGFKMVFYGDNNWLPLFPDFFLRYEGTNSFYVRDFTEVDHNVTKNVIVEIENKDWNIMILHYLGLDHIGHVYGPFSDKIPPKLLEMDQIIERIHTKMVGEKAAILVTGDHGMKDSGGHGGNTNPEVNVPLIALGVSCQNSSFQQTDIPANLAVSLGIKIPSTSIGKIQRSFLKFLTEEQFLYALHYNTKVLLNWKNVCQDEFQNAYQFHAAYLRQSDEHFAELATNWYEKCSQKLTDSLLERTYQQHTFLLLLSVLSLASVLTIFFVLILTKLESNKVLEFCIILLVNFANLFLQTHSISYISVTVLVTLIIRNIHKCYSTLKFGRVPDFLHKFLITMFFLHPLMLFSTSYIEEEQYFWYYFGTTFFIILIIHNIKKYASILEVVSLGFVLGLLRIIREINNLNRFLQENDNANIVFCLGLTSVLYILVRNEKNTQKQVSFYILTIFLIFLLKIHESQQSILLGKVIWLMISLDFLFFSRLKITKNICILVTTLLLKPVNVCLISVCVLVSNLCLTKKSPFYSSMIAYLYSNYFYFAQGHSNNLASVDISVGYIGLADYSPFIVITQNVVHIFIFMIFFNITALEKKDSNFKIRYWLGLFILKTSVILLTFVNLVVNRYHLFIWSVFAPKLFIESVHLGFLFVQVSLWYCSYVLGVIFRPCYSLDINNKKD